MEKSFSKNHIWVSAERNVAAMGVTGRAKKGLGEIMFLNLPEIGEKLEIGKRFGDIEGVKKVFDLISPLDGEVIEINEKVFEEQEEIDDGIYEDWFVKARYDKMDEGLMDETAYFGDGEPIP